VNTPTGPAAFSGARRAGAACRSGGPRLETLGAARHKQPRAAAAPAAEGGAAKRERSALRSTRTGKRRTPVRTRRSAGKRPRTAGPGPPGGRQRERTSRQRQRDRAQAPAPGHLRPGRGKLGKGLERGSSKQSVGAPAQRQPVRYRARAKPIAPADGRPAGRGLATGARASPEEQERQQRPRAASTARRPRAQ